METRKRPLRVCYFGTYRANYSRNQLMMAGLRKNGVDVIECHATLWHGIEDRVQATTGGWKHPAFWARVIVAYAQLLCRYATIRDYDVLIVGYPGQVDIYLARLLSWLKRKPLVWDVFMSIYLIALERGLEQRSQFTVGLIRQIEQHALRLPDILILDTENYVAWFEQVHRIPPHRFRLVPTGADDRVFRPVNNVENSDRRFIVTYHGSFIPNHGIPYILEAARLLKDHSEITFELIGNGPEQPSAHQMVEQNQLTNVIFHKWVEKEKLPQYLGHAALCLGAFGQTPQSIMTIQNKIYEGMAMGKAVITGDSPAISAVLQHGKEIYLCERQNGSALAQAIQTLYKDDTLRQHIAQQGYARFHQSFDIAHLGETFIHHLNEILDSRNSL
jgi:glycosyltransferase involved in cell wall biosynthesis